MTMLSSPKCMFVSLFPFFKRNLSRVTQEEMWADCAATGGN